MEELNLDFLCVSALSYIQFLVCLEKTEAEHGDLVYFSAVKQLNGANLLKRFTEQFP
jgi:hypothetical protein